MSSKLFSDPVISTSDVFNNQDTLPGNSGDFDPNEESLYDRDDSTEDVAATKTIDDTNPTLTNDDIFTDEPVKTQKKVNKSQINNVADKIDQTYYETPVKEYEDEPTKEASTRAWIIGGLIAAIIILCLGWFGFSLLSTRNNVPAEQAKTTTETQTKQTPEQTTPPANTDNQIQEPADNSSSSGSSAPSNNYSSGSGNQNSSGSHGNSNNYQPNQDNNNGNGSGTAAGNGGNVSPDNETDYNEPAADEGSTDESTGSSDQGIDENADSEYDNTEAYNNPSDNISSDSGSVDNGDQTNSGTAQSDSAPIEESASGNSAHATTE